MKTDPVTAATKTYDFCIVGSGPAGITTALELERLQPDASILLVEFGRDSMPAKNVLDDTIEVRNSVNHHDPYECTNKGLGGSSASWGGRCVMYDEVDFLPRPIVGDDCTWDQSILQETAPYVSRTQEIFECGTGPFDLVDCDAPVPPIAEHFVRGDVTDTVVERWSMPTRFGVRYRDHLYASDRIDVLENCMAKRFGDPETNGHIASLTLTEMSDGTEFVVRATVFVIAAGTQETTRLLLVNPQLFKSIGGPPDALGRYYQGHVSGKIASVKFHGDPKKTDYGFIQEADGPYVRRRFQFPASVLRRENLLNTAIWLDNPLYFDPSHRSGAMSFMYLAMITPVLGKKLAPPAISHSVTKGKVTGVPQHIMNILRGLPGSLLTPATIFYKRYLLKRKLPGVFLYSPENRYALHFHAEQIPHRENRMELGADGESLIIHYDLVDDDVKSVIRCHELLDQSLRASNCGHLEYWFPKAELPAAIRAMSKDGIHQSGTTRIGDSPQSGVVDRDLKLFGPSNVYVCSSSAFPTSGQANPTFFMCAMACRLAGHLTQSGKWKAES